MMKEEIDQVEENEISLSEIFSIIKNRFWLLVAITLFGGLVLGVYAYGIATPKYKSTGSVMVQVRNATEIEGINSTESQRLIDTVMQLLTDIEKIPAQVSNNLKEQGYDISTKDVRSGMSVSNNNRGLIINVGFTSTEIELSEIAAEAIIDNLVILANDPDFGIDITFKNNITKLEVGKAVYVSPNKPLLILVGMILGGTVGLILAFSYEMINRGFKTKEELENYTGIHVLGVVPEYIVIEGEHHDKKVL